MFVLVLEITNKIIQNLKDDKTGTEIKKTDFRDHSLSKILKVLTFNLSKRLFQLTNLNFKFTF